MARTTLLAQHFNTIFGQLWLVLNPLLLAGVYFMLVDILRCGLARADLLRAPDRRALRLLLRLGFAAAGRQVGHGRREADPQHGVPARAAAALGRAHGVHALPADDRDLHPGAHHRRAAGGARSTCGCSPSSALMIVLAAAPRCSSPPRRSTSATSRTSCRTCCASGCTCRRSSTTPRGAPRLLVADRRSTRSAASWRPGATSSTWASRRARYARARRRVGVRQLRRRRAVLHVAGA